MLWRQYVQSGCPIFKAEVEKEFTTLARQKNDSKTVKPYLKSEQLTEALTDSFFPEKYKKTTRRQSCMETWYLHIEEIEESC